MNCESRHKKFEQTIFKNWLHWHPPWRFVAVRYERTHKHTYGFACKLSFCRQHLIAFVIVVVVVVVIQTHREKRNNEMTCLTFVYLAVYCTAPRIACVIWHKKYYSLWGASAWRVLAPIVPLHHSLVALFAYDFVFFTAKIPRAPTAGQQRTSFCQSFGQTVKSRVQWWRNSSQESHTERPHTWQCS